eukprot:5367406-Lingulodinium_polyedra.AAC.1
MAAEHERQKHVDTVHKAQQSFLVAKQRRDDCHARYHQACKDLERYEAASVGEPQQLQLPTIPGKDEVPQEVAEEYEKLANQLKGMRNSMAEVYQRLVGMATKPKPAVVQGTKRAGETSNDDAPDDAEMADAQDTQPAKTPRTQ